MKEGAWATYGLATGQNFPNPLTGTTRGINIPRPQSAISLTDFV